MLNGDDMQLGHGETIADTARTVSRFCNAIMLRCFEEGDLLELAQHSSVPVINALTNQSHPCQIMAAAMTFLEYKKDLQKSKLAWFGDFNNVANSYIEFAEKMACELVISVPELTREQEKRLSIAQNLNPKIYYEQNPQLAAADADIIITDTWVSMGDKKKDLTQYLPHQVNKSLISLAKKDCLFSHCLPAHRGEEVTNEIIDGERSIVFDEAENRLHIQKALLLYMFDII